jgi:hypothetical protein
MNRSPGLMVCTLLWRPVIERLHGYFTSVFWDGCVTDYLNYKNGTSFRCLIFFLLFVLFFSFRK